MINRTLNAASAALVCSLAIAAINYANATDTCRAGPGTAGGHWRYRLEKGTGSKCWYLSGVSDAASVAEEKPSAEPKLVPAAPKLKSTEMQLSVADARAELTTSESAQLNATVWPPLQNTPMETNQSHDTAAPVQKQNMVLAQRWPESNSVRSSDDEFVEKMRVAANTSTQDATPITSGPITDSKTPDIKDDSASSPLRILLIAMIGIFALASILLRAATIYLAKRRKRNAPRRAIWDDLAIDAEQMPPFIPRSAPTQPAQYTGQHHPRYAYRDDEDAREEIESLLRRAAHREQH